MNKYVKNKLEALLRQGFDELLNRLRLNQIYQNSFNNQATQRMLFFHYQHLHRTGAALPRFEDTGFRVYSQNDEDGLLLYIFALIGMTKKVCVDIGAAQPYGANTTNLLCNWGWRGLLIEGNERMVHNAQVFFQRHKDTWTFPPTIIQAWITAENINQLVKEQGFAGEIDLLSLDLDGVDYWLWKSLDVVQPRVVVVEYQDMWGSEKAMTVPYRPDFQCPDTTSFNYCGASLPAFVKLARDKGLRLVGANSYGFNAFFVRNGIAEDVLPEVPIELCLQHPRTQERQRQELPLAKQYEWVEV